MNKVKGTFELTPDPTGLDSLTLFVDNPDDAMKVWTWTVYATKSEMEGLFTPSDKGATRTVTVIRTINTSL